MILQHSRRPLINLAVALCLPTALAVTALASAAFADATPGLELSDASTATLLVEQLDRHLDELERFEQNLSRFAESQQAVEAELLLDHLDALKDHLRALEGLEAQRLSRRIEALVMSLQPEPLEQVSHRDPTLPTRLEAAHRAGKRSIPFSLPFEKAPLAAADTCAEAPAIDPGVFLGDTRTATSDGSASCGFTQNARDVWLQFTPSTPGEFLLSTRGSGYDTVLSIHTACPGAEPNELVCSDTPAEPELLRVELEAGIRYWIRVSGYADDAGPFTLQVGPGGTISGTVTDSTTGQALADALVALWQGDSPSSYTSTRTDDDGRYAFRGLPDLTFLATATPPVPGLLSQLHEAVDCLGSPIRECASQDGTPLEVGLNTTFEVDFALVPGGSMSGRVTREATGAPVADARVRVRLVDTSVSREAVSDADGRWRIDGLAAGDYRAIALAQGLIDELYDDIPCELNNCDASQATLLNVTPSTELQNVDFALSPAGTISGRVTDARTGEPLPFIGIRFFDSSGFASVTTTTDIDGRYLRGLSAGSYRVRTDSRRQYADELYDDVLCPLRGLECDLTRGTPFDVAPGVTISGVDFALEPGGQISGRVTDAATGEPVWFDNDVDIWSADGDLVTYAGIDASGAYTASGLLAGTYFATTGLSSGQPYVDGLFDDQLCLQGPDLPRCDPTVGTPIEVLFNQTTSGVDFALRRRGSITGRLTDAATGEPLAGFRVFARSETANNAAVSSAEDGSYRFDDLLPATYSINAGGEQGYLRELYDGILCPPGTFCLGLNSTPVEVAADRVTEGIDLTLEPGGVIRGQVTDAVTGEPLAATLTLRAENLSDQRVASADGSFAFDGLASGTYRLEASSRGYVAEVYDNLACREECPDAGTPIVVTRGETTAGIDFALDRRASFSGRLSSEATGEPISGRVFLWSSEGTLIDTAGVPSSGVFELTAAAAGTYFLTAGDDGNLVAEVYPGIPCPLFSCDPRIGTPISAELNSGVTGLDFELGAGGQIAGSITDVTGQPINVIANLWDAAGGFVGWQRSDSRTGRFQISGLSSGDYFLSTDDSSAFVHEVFDDIPCEPEPCEPTTGTPIRVVGGTVTAGIHVELDRRGEITGRLIDEATGEPIPRRSVLLWSPDGSFIGVDLTDDAGVYLLRSLPQGPYTLTTFTDERFIDEVHENIPCPAEGCDPTLGTPVLVPINTTVVVDFRLQRAPDETALLLTEDRFQVDVEWQTSAGEAGTARAIELTDDAGYFWFFNADNVEIVVKVLDACAISDRFWVFAAGLTDVGTRITVTDRVTGETRVYSKPVSTEFAPIQDTNAFATCEAVLPPAAGAQPTAMKVLPPERVRALRTATAAIGTAALETAALETAALETMALGTAAPGTTPEARQQVAGCVSSTRRL
ncbi:MAG: carboxypeptidase-like regulatory domain-containing protein, partial [Acidobacteriota bacterium]